MISVLGTLEFSAYTREGNLLMPLYILSSKKKCTILIHREDPLHKENIMKPVIARKLDKKSQEIPMETIVEEDWENEFT